MGRVQARVQACCKWGGTTQLLYLFTSNDLGTCAVMSDTNEDIRGVLWLTINPLEIIIARESSKIQETELLGQREGIFDD